MHRALSSTHTTTKANKQLHIVVKSNDLVWNSSFSTVVWILVLLNPPMLSEVR